MKTRRKRQRHDGLRKVCDCPPKEWSRCSHGWHLAFMWRGKHYRFSLDRHVGKHVDSKTRARAIADDIRKEIREGTFGRPAPRESMTLRELADVYEERYVAIERADRADAFATALRTICRTAVPATNGEAFPLGEWRLVDIVTDTIERFREVRRASGTGPTGVNRNLESLRALFNWAIKVGYLEETPFRRHSQAVVTFSDEPPRSRRLNADVEEESRLLAACQPHLRALVEAALETGMRRGELLSLQWHQVDGMRVDDETRAITWAARAYLVLPWSKTKTRRDRRIPISARLRAILELRRLDPNGDALPLSTYVFGNAIGQQVLDIKRAWHTAVLKAHGHVPTFTKTANLSAESRQVFEAIDLHFHDLRREAGSRWLEGGVPLHVVRDWLGHTSIAQTSTYLSNTLQTQHDAMAAFEATRASLQNLANFSGTPGRKRPRSGKRRDKTANETGVERDQTVM